MDGTGADFQLSLLTGNDKYVYVRVHHQKSQRNLSEIELLFLLMKWVGR